jgi:RNA polymerase sigma factor (sigma-70 family)
MEAHALPRTGRLFLPRSKKLLAALSDERLVEQVRRGNEAAFEVVFDRHHRGILSFCRHMLASPDEAEDAVQQTFISAFDSLQGSERDVKLKAWLYTIARNRCLSILRARREQPAELDDVPTVGLAEEVQQRSDLRELLDDLRGLPVDQRAALVLSEIGDLSHADVAAIVGCEVAKVKSLVFQARSSLIESRRARDIPCSEIREQLATASGGALRRGPLRRHLRACEGCAEFRDEVMRQRKAIALLLPVVPSLGLKKGALAAFGIGGGGGAGGAAAGLGGGGIASLASTSAAVKVVGAVVVASVAVGGGIVLEHGSSPPAADAAQGPAAASHARPAHPSAAGPGAALRRGAHARTAHAGAKSKHSGRAGGNGSASRKGGNGASGAHNGTGGGKPQQHAGHGQSGGVVTQQGPGSTPTPVAPGSGPGNGAGNGNGNAYGNGNGNAGGNGNGAANGNAGGSSAASGSNGAAGYDHSAHGGQGVGNGGTPPGQVDNPHSNAGGNGNGSATSSAGGNGKGNGKASGTA